ncbi:hypothetical protein FIBSPDRAFT_337759 [Athelia psychrophila]|uniref:Uncharacterized protein n=1 Tax=Athelia psychrophila TaxID=1759441 RepID=A0A167WBS9_9AGAM|nr:hypothetical protein FIBSPDRAFT_337759 [Fibularhizoctonia sp. CBS 109695]
MTRRLVLMRLLQSRPWCCMSLLNTTRAESNLLVRSSRSFGRRLLLRMGPQPTQPNPGYRKQRNSTNTRAPVDLHSSVEPFGLVHSLLLFSYPRYTS